MTDTDAEKVVDAVDERMYRRDEVLVMLEARRLWHHRHHPVYAARPEMPLDRTVHARRA